MLKLAVKTNVENAVSLIGRKDVKSAHYYSAYADWLDNRFIPSYHNGESTIVTAHCKTYDTVVGFALLKHNSEEVKISNLSPLVDGVGVSQALLDSVDFVLNSDYDIYIPVGADRLIRKVKQLGFHHVEEGISGDGCVQHHFTKPRNITWI